MKSFQKKNRMYERSWKDVKYPTHRDAALGIKSSDLWLESRRLDDGAEGLWRVHDGLYDLTSFVETHPGGSMWLTLTKGTDITEAFEAHHFSLAAEKKLPDFFVRKANTPRNFPFTFHPNGFYRTLKERARKHFNYKTPPVSFQTRFTVDSYFTAAIIFCILAAKYENLFYAAIAGVLFGLIVNSVHNFLHMKDSWRNYYYYFVSFSVRDWRITHCLSHHLYPNTLEDLEISLFEPAFQFLPKKDKTFLIRFGSWLYFPVVCSILPYFQVLSRIRSGVFRKQEFLMLVPLALMLIFGKFSLTTFYLWMWIISICGFVFASIGLTAAHHSPEIFHEGDKPRKDSDWGLFQVDAISDRTELVGNKFVGLIVFGDHTLHHIFPTLDFCNLQELLPLYYKTLEEFGVELNVKPVTSLIFGAFKQLARITHNTVERKQKKIVLE